MAQKKEVPMRSIGWFLAIALVVGYFMFPRGLAGKLPPVLAQDGVRWLNSGPLTWDELRGDVVWLEFSFMH